MVRFLKEIKLRILLITSRADIGGGPKHLLDLALEIKQDNPSSFLAIASPDQDPYGPLFRKNSDFFIDIPIRKFSPWTFLSLLIFCKTREIEVIHSHGRGAGIYSRLLSLFSFKVFHTFHGIQLKESFSNKLKNFIEKLLSYLNCYLIFVSDSEMENALLLNYSTGENYKVIENGIDLQDLDIEIKLKKSSQKVNICILSRFDPHKNIKRSIELFNLAQQENPSLRLNIGGYGREETPLKQLVENLGLTHKVKFLGKINKPEEFLKEQHIYLSTSLGEGLPYTVLEAIKVGLIPFLSNVSGHKDIVSKEYLFNPFNEHEFCTGLNMILNKSHFQLKESLTIRFDLNVQIKKVIAVYT